MPKEGSLVKFHDGQNQFKVPFLMYADFESILNPIESSESNPEESYTKVINQHVPSGFCAYSKFAYGKVENPLKLYRGEDCVEVFCNYISNEAKRLYHMFPEKPMKPLILKAQGFFLPVQHWGVFSTPLCKIRSRHPRKLKLTGLIAYIMFYKICKLN